MSKTPKTFYNCTNKACSLGTIKTPGRFAGGITAQQAMNLTGDPKSPHGTGYCPNCGQKGKRE